MANREFDKMTDLEKSLLTDEEHAALEGEQDGDEANAGAPEAELPKGTPDNPVTEMVDEDDPDAPADDDDQPAAEGKPAAKTATAEEPEAAEEDAPRRERESMTFVMPEGEARDFDGELQALAKKFEDGELTTAEFATQQAQIIRAQATADVARGINEAQWTRDVKRFLRDHEQYQSPVLYSALNTALELVGKEEGAERLDGDELLERAHKRVAKEFGLAPTPDAATSKGRPLPKAAEAEAKARKAAPKTLAELPAADDGDATGGRFAHIDRLTGVAQETAIAKMTPAEVEAWLAEQ